VLMCGHDAGSRANHQGARKSLQRRADDILRGDTVQTPDAVTVIGAADLLNQVFENLISNAIMFGDGSRSRDVDGSGLGLSLAREIARAHGGELVLEQSEDHKTTFRLTLPSADPLAPAADSCESAGPAGS
jgi:signal transduction histidine kinase